MAFIDNNTLSGARNLILPGVDAVMARAAAEGVPIRKSDLWVDFVNDELQLCVSYGLVRRGDLDEGRAHFVEQIAARLNAVRRLLHRTTEAKALCVDRRRLMSRGEKARKEANRPVRKASKAH